MSIKVLVFESDSAFAGELRNELGNLGCAVRIVDDGNVGLQQAQAERPDLILLSIELPRMNGFSVCNKLKKDAELKDVPLIIMSSESSDETFEQHKKLRTRAEAYVHKPIAFGQLLQEIEPFVALRANDFPGTGNPDDSQEISGIVIVVVDAVTGSARPPSIELAPDSQRTAMFQVPFVPKNRHVDPDVDAFADDAFGRLQAGEDPSVTQPPRPLSVRPAATVAPPSTPPASRRSVLPPLAADTSANDEAAAQARAASEAAAQALEASEAELEQARALLGSTSGELESARVKAGELEQSLRSAEAEIDRVRAEAVAEAERLKLELDELKSRPAVPVKGGSVPPKAGGGVSSREFLDLREALSKKDKEILALKQQLTSKDKEIFETRDRSLAHEGRVSELDDRVLAKDRELAEAFERIDDLGAQLESTKKSLESTEADVQRLDKELLDLKAKREQDNVSHEAATAALKADHADALQALRAEHVDADRLLREETETRLAKAEAAHKNELDAAEAAHTATREESASALAAAGAAHAATREDAAGTLAAAEAAHTATREESARTLAAAEAAHVAAQEEAGKEHASALARQAKEAEETHAAALAAREAELRSETETKLASLHRSQQDELARLGSEAEGRENALKGSVSDTKQELAGVERRLEEVNVSRTALESQLGSAASKAAALEEELAALRGELDDTRKDLVRESSRATRALAKWEADKASLERAKDALAVALSQLDEAEARQISE